MELKIIQEKQSPLFARKEIILEVKNSVIPSKQEVEKLISEKFSISHETFVIKKIESKFGTQVFKIYVNIYESKKEKDFTETKTKKQKETEKKAEEEKLKAETETKSAKQPIQETSEEKKEEIKTEEKTE